MSEGFTIVLVILSVAAAIAGCIAAVFAMRAYKAAGSRESANQAQRELSKLIQEENARARQEQQQSLAQLRQEMTQGYRNFSEAMDASNTNQIKRIAEISRGNDEKMEHLRQAMERQMVQLRKENADKLGEMRQTVDERLQSTLEKRLGESFKQVSDRLEQVHKGLGEMQTLAQDVGGLKKVLTNVKTRGIWGEIQLGNLLEQMLAPEQYAKNVLINPRGRERVEYAICLPGQGDETVFLALDAKFPQEDYQRLVDTAERGDAEATEQMAKALGRQIDAQAKLISDKYICPPHSVDFAIMFLPVEGLYAEVLRQPGLSERIQQKYRVTITGPTTLAALLNSLQMGFKTLAIQKRSSEVWQLLSVVKTQFSQFADLLTKTREKLDAAAKTIDDASKKSRYIQRRMSRVEELPQSDTPLLGNIEQTFMDEFNEESL